MSSEPKQDSMLIEWLLVDPETGEELRVCDDMKDNGDGSCSFTVASHDRSRMWKHTIKTEEEFTL